MSLRQTCDSSCDRLSGMFLLVAHSGITRLRICQFGRLGSFHRKYRNGVHCFKDAAEKVEGTDHVGWPNSKHKIR